MSPAELIPRLSPLIHEAGNPYYDWFFGGPARARASVERRMASPPSELAVKRITALVEGSEVLGALLSLPGAELARCRQADTLSELRAAGTEGRSELESRMAVTRGLFPAVEPDEFYLSKLAVSGDRRGEGLGRRLVEEYLSSGSAKGFGRFRLDVAVDNQPAIRLYESAGFDAVRTSTSAGAGLTYLTMALGTER